MTAAILIEDFTAIDIRVGTIVDATDLPQTRNPAWKLTIDLGAELGMKRSSAQITQLYSRSTLLGRQVMCVVNLPPRRIGPFLSEVLVLGLPDDSGRIVLIAPERSVPNGARLY